MVKAGGIGMNLNYVAGILGTNEDKNKGESNRWVHYLVMYSFIEKLEG